ncbi:hypothetical protein COCNU_13G001830 [Cocos nucifera]|uniref:Uncharacterized protein n=1 Tax=Cocos nucifera TaxID=13894 RepID=A0A8K0NB80_COCNU|nr:hypothetical protein COCNU_13G001830 [Cocos nucifera]
MTRTQRWDYGAPSSTDLFNPPNLALLLARGTSQQLRLCSFPFINNQHFLPSRAPDWQEGGDY